MLQYSKKVKKDRVARMQPPYLPEPCGFEKMTAAKPVIEKRHSELHSWVKLSRELGDVNPGTLVGLANGKRKPTRKMIDKLNRFYGCRIPYPPIPVEPCARCGQLHAFQRRCPGAPTKPRRTYDISYKRLRAVMQSDMWNGE